MSVVFREMKRFDLPEVIEVERQSFEFPWNDSDFIDVLRNESMDGFVCEEDGLVVGYYCVEKKGSRCELLNIAVHSNHRRCGFGAMMFNRELARMQKRDRNEIRFRVREMNLDAQLFFKSLGAKCVGIDKEYYDETSEDSYRFKYNLGEAETTFLTRARFQLPYMETQE